MIINSITPDPQIIAMDFIECLNASNQAYSNENEWLGGSKVKVLCDSDMFYNMTVNQTYPENAGLCPYSRGGDEYGVFEMDGYRINFYDTNGQLAFNLVEGIDKYWATGTLSVKYLYDIGEKPQYALLMDVEKVEPHEEN